MPAPVNPAKEKVQLKPTPSTSKEHPPKRNTRHSWKPFKAKTKTSPGEGLTSGLVTVARRLGYTLVQFTFERRFCSCGDSIEYHKSLLRNSPSLRGIDSRSLILSLIGPRMKDFFANLQSFKRSRQLRKGVHEMEGPPTK